MSKIKICGIRRPEDIVIANRYRPDYIGFVFCRKSRRFISPEDAAALRRDLSPEIKPVGVFLDNTDEEILEAVSSGAADLVQIHETAETDIERIRGKLMKNGKKTDIIRAVSVRNEQSIREAKESRADYILLDNGRGGTGMSFDWQYLKDIGRDFFLAGGLSAENLEEALVRFHPYAIDLSGGAETDGVKDPEKVSRIVEIVRSFNKREESGRMMT